MLKVFLVEDETVIREGLRDRIPWEQYGYRFVGEAADGEVALPLIRKTRPDVLITDIKMPFMDGLSLSRIVREEFPKTKKKSRQSRSRKIFRANWQTKCTNMSSFP